MATSEIILDTSEIKEGLKKYGKKANIALDLYCDTVAKDLEREAKTKRPWTDRTARARQGLTGYANKSTNKKEICLAHTVDYGVYLEYAHEKRFAILEPTVRLKSNDVLSGIKTLFNSMGNKV